jgi:hypothetical protein
MLKICRFTQLRSMIFSIFLNSQILRKTKQTQKETKKATVDDIQLPKTNLFSENETQ